MKNPRITIAPLQGHGCNQIVEFYSVTGEMTFVQGELVDQSNLPKGDWIEVHNELDEEGNVIHIIYVTY
jgi:hypothetical protein